MNIEVTRCDFNNEQHIKAVIFLLKHYMTGTMGGLLKPHSSELADKVIEGLKSHPSKLVLLSSINNEFVGMTVGFINFATFTAQPFLNIHDVVVLEKYRGTGVGTKLMEENISISKEINCSKITLEVREDNFAAKKLYNKFGFEESHPPMHFWSKYLIPNI